MVIRKGQEENAWNKLTRDPKQYFEGLGVSVQRTDENPLGKVLSIESKPGPKGNGLVRTDRVVIAISHEYVIWECKSNSRCIPDNDHDANSLRYLLAERDDNNPRDTGPEL